MDIELVKRWWLHFTEGREPISRTDLTAAFLFQTSLLLFSFFSFPPSPIFSTRHFFKMQQFSLKSPPCTTNHHPGSLQAMLDDLRTELRGSSELEITMKARNSSSWKAWEFFWWYARKNSSQNGHASLISIKHPFFEKVGKWASFLGTVDFLLTIA